MAEFDDIIRHGYKPTGNGTYISTACAFCGSQTFVLEDSGPECLPCSVAIENAVVYSEAAAAAITKLLTFVRDLPPGPRAALRGDVLAWRVQLERILMECQP